MDRLIQEGERLQVNLQTVMDEIDVLTHRMIEAQTAHSTYNANDLAQAKEECALVENAATMEAYASSKIDGKNAEQRATQLAAWLTGQGEVLVVRAELRNAEITAARLQAQRDAAELEYKAATYRLHAMRAIADIQAGSIRALASE